MVFFYVCQRKYTIDLQSETGLLGSKPVDTQFDRIINSFNAQIQQT